MNRFDIPETIKEIINTAIKLEVIDESDVYCMAITHKKDWRALVVEICETAYSWIHVDSSKHKVIVEAAEKYWKEIFI